ncbi:MAG: hypothetical protein V3V47_01815 [Desulfobacteria bacterium]
MKAANFYFSLTPGENRQPIKTSLGFVYIRVEEMDVNHVGEALDVAEPIGDESVMN